MKKVFVIVLLILILFSFNFILAQEELPAPNPSSGRTNFDELGERFGKIDINFESLNLSVNFSRLLLGILLWMVLYSIFSEMRLFENTSVYWSGGVALIVTLLAFIYIPSDLINAIGTEYGALGATVLTVIPFVIAIYFSVWVSKSVIIARLIWLAFFLYYVVILGYAWGNVSYETFNLWEPPNLYYAIASFISLLFFIFLSPIRRLVWEEHVKSVEERINRNISEFGVGLRAGREVAREAGRTRGRGFGPY